VKTRARDLVLVDTNVVVYAHDPTNPEKHEIARRLLSDLKTAQRLAYTAQVLNEFCSRMLRPDRPPALTPEHVREVVADLQATGEVFPLTGEATSLAMDAVIAYKMSFWDALIWATALENGVPVIYTEDLPGAAEIEGVRYVNPFE